MSEHDIKLSPNSGLVTSRPSTDSNSANDDHNPADDGNGNVSGNARAAGDATDSKTSPSGAAPDPFDPMNLGISTDYAAAINAQTAVKAFEPRKPNNQEYFRVSPLPQHSLIVASITDKQDTGKVYLVSGPILEAVKTEFPRAVRGVMLVLAQTLVGTGLAWPVPLAEDRGGKWHSTERAACEQGKTRWTSMASENSRGQYEVGKVNNPKQVNWESFPPFADILRRAYSDRLIDSLDHPVLNKLRGKIE